jgi:hypothetical protein
LPAQSNARSRITSTAASVADEALSWITPSTPVNPTACASQDIIAVSSSVAAGEVCHSMHCAAMVEDRNSASIEGGVALAGK